MPGIKAGTRERVLQVANELGYAPSRFARGLVQGSHVSVGLAIPDLENPYFPAFASSVVEQATARGWHVVVDDFGHGGRTGLDAVERLAPQVDAVIGYLGSDVQRAAQLMSRRPLVALDCTEPLGDSSIIFDYRYAAGEAAAFLRRSGRRNVAYLDAFGQGGLSPRAQAFVDALNDAGAHSPGDLAGAMRVTVRTAAGESASSAGAAVAALLAERPETDAVIAFNDVMAAGVLKALAVGGRRVPEDCAVLGMDGIPMGELLTPALTTLALDLREVGRTAVEVLDGLLSGDIPLGAPAAHRVIRHTLVVRESA